MITIKADCSDVDKHLDVYLTTLQTKHAKDVVRCGAQVYANAYVARLKALRNKKKGNTGVKSYEGVAFKVRSFKDGTGAYAVVGAVLAGSRPLAPQLRFGERGTTYRRTKAGLNRGRMPVQAWLSKTKAANVDMALKAMKLRLETLVRN